MKKKIIAVLLCASAIMSLTACGGKTDSTEIVKEDGASKEQGTKNSKTSADFEINYAKQVVELCDYSAIPVELSADLEVTDAAVNDYFTKLVTSYGVNIYHKITDRDVVEAGDYVDVDYTGYKDGKAFEGGAAQAQLLDVSKNCAVAGTPFIEGFTAGIIGGKVGETVDCDVTFPEGYASEELAGQPAVFTFVINGIYDTTPMTLDELDDKYVKENLSDLLGVSTVQELKDGIKVNLKNQLLNASSEQILEYLVENSKVEIPEEYLQTRIEEYVDYYKQNNITDGSTLDEFMQNNYGVTESEARDNWKTGIEEQIKQEFILLHIAELEGQKLDEDEFNDFKKNYMASNNIQSEDDFYKGYGYGNAELGKVTIKNQFLESKALNQIAENAVITYVDGDEKETSDTVESED